MALRRASQQAYRLELHACALTSAAAARWAVLPQPQAITEESQQESVRRQLRTLAVMVACFAPFTAWARLIVLRRADRIASVRTEAVASLRLTRLRANAMTETLGRVRKQDTTLRKLADRVSVRSALELWRGEVFEAGRRRGGLSMLRRGWLHRWRSGASYMRLYGPKPIAAVHGAQCLAAFVALRRNVAIVRWLASRRVLEVLAVGFGALRMRRHTRRRLHSASAACRRVYRLRVLGRTLRDWAVRRLADVKGGYSAHQDVALRSLLQLWASTAAEAVYHLAAPPPEAERQGRELEASTLRALIALGGTWAGGRPALAQAVGETLRLKVRLLEERRERFDAAVRSDGAAEVCARVISIDCH